METKQNGRYVLVGPVPGGYDWWAINDFGPEKGYARVTVQADWPNAEAVIRLAWDQIPEKEGSR